MTIKSLPAESTSSRRSELALDFILPYLQATSITKFSASNLFHPSPKPFVISKSEVFHVANLTLTGCRLKSRALASLLLCFHSLKYFEYEYVKSDTIPCRLRRGLSNSRNTLEELIVIHTPIFTWQEWVESDDSASEGDDSNYEEEDGIDLKVLGPLHTFEKLR